MKLLHVCIICLVVGCGGGGGEDSESSSTSSNSSVSSEVNCVFLTPTPSTVVNAGEATDENIQKALKGKDGFFIANCGSGDVSYNEDNSVTTTTTTTETNSDVEIQ